MFEPISWEMIPLQPRRPLVKALAQIPGSPEGKMELRPLCQSIQCYSHQNQEELPLCDLCDQALSEHVALLHEALGRI